MKKNVKSALQLAVLSGFVAGMASHALAADKAAAAPAGDKAHAEKCKDGCKGKCDTPEKKKECKEHHAKTGKGDKNGCGNDSCSGPAEKPAKEEAKKK